MIHKNNNLYVIAKDRSTTGELNEFSLRQIDLTSEVRTNTLQLGEGEQDYSLSEYMDDQLIVGCEKGKLQII